MIVANLYRCCDFGIWRTINPIHAIDFKLLRNQIVFITDNDTICLRIDIHDITRPRRAAGQTPALTNGK